MGTVRAILDVTKRIKFVVYKHFKMENLQTATKLTNKNCFMASDWKEALFFLSTEGMAKVISSHAF